MDVGAAFVADGEAAEAMQPGDGAFDDPSRDVPKPLPCGVRRLSEDGPDAAGPQAVTMRLGVVAAVALQRVRGLRRGRPRRPRTAGRASTIGSRCVMSLTFAAVTCATSGTPRAR